MFKQYFSPWENVSYDLDEKDEEAKTDEYRLRELSVRKIS